MPPLVSVILTSYNKPRTIQQAIQSVFDQSYSHWELWIMDDHSEETVRSLISDYLNDPRVHFFDSGVDNQERYRRTRYAVLINQALAQANGQYITYLTDDTQYMKERLEKMANFLTHSAKQVVYSSQRVIQVDDQFRREKQWIIPADAILADAAFKVDHCSVMHSRDLLQGIHEKYNSYWDDDPKYWSHADAIFWRRLNERAAFYPLNEILEETYKSPRSYQRLSQHLNDHLLDGSFIRAGNGEIFTVDQGSRRLLTAEWLALFKISAKEIIDVPDPLLFRYPEMEPIDGKRFIPSYRLCCGRQGGSFYYLEHHRKRRLFDQNTVRFYRFRRQECMGMDEQQLAALPDGPEITGPWQKSFQPPNHRLFLSGNRLWITQDNQFCTIDNKVRLRYRLSEQPVPLKAADLQRCSG
ncbi:MAG: glycosyltransferase family 2 protein [Sporolactobacillus sp.]